MLSYGSHQLDEDDIAAVTDVLRHGWLTQGEKVPEFEQALATYVGCRHAVCVSSGTAALHLACLALGVDGTSRVWVPAITFVASANCARYCGATVDFVDVHAATGNMCLDALEKKLILAETENCLPDLVVVVDLTGRPMDMAVLKRLKQRYGFKIIDDASHALGAEYSDGIKVGNHAAADITTISFHPVKPITTAEGGAILTDQADLAELISRLRTHGILRSPDCAPWYYDQQHLGFNYRMSDLQAALGVSQLSKIDQFIQLRREVAEGYKLLADLEGIELPPAVEYGRSGWHLYTIRITDDAPIGRDELMGKLQSVGVGVQLHYLPVYSHSYYRRQVGGQYRLENSEIYSASAISLPIHCNLTSEQQKMVINQVKRFLG